MAQEPIRDAPGKPGPNAAGDIGRRIKRRRTERGLNQAETAAHAGMSVTFLNYLETSPAHIGAGTLARLAAALGTSPEELLGGGFGLPPGRGRAAAHPVLEELPRSECWARLSTDGVGRVALCTTVGPLVLPVNYWVLDGTMIFRTAVDGPLAGAVGHRVAFEVDRIDEVLRTGWSVLAVGVAHRIDDRIALAHLKQRDVPSPWAGGERDLWVRIKPTELSGRTIDTIERPTH